MAFDPTEPAANSPLSSQEMRDQFTALKALIDAQPVAADWTSGSASFTDVGGLAFAVAAGENWTAEMVLHCISGTTGQGLKLRVNGLGADSAMIAIQGTGSSTSTAMEGEVQTAFGVASPAKTFCAGSGLTGLVRIHVVITNASAGTIKANSDLVARKTGSVPFAMNLRAADCPSIGSHNPRPVAQSAYESRP